MKNGVVQYMYSHDVSQTDFSTTMRLVGEDAVYTLSTADDITMDDIEKNMVVVVRSGGVCTMQSILLMHDGVVCVQITMISIFGVYCVASILTYVRDRRQQRRITDSASFHKAKHQGKSRVASETRKTSSGSIRDAQVVQQPVQKCCMTEKKCALITKGLSRCVQCGVCVCVCVILDFLCRFCHTIRTQHAWFSIYFLYSAFYTRTQRLTILLNVLVCFRGGVLHACMYSRFDACAQITQAFTTALLYNTQSKGDGNVTEIVAYAILSTLIYCACGVRGWQFNYHSCPVYTQVRFRRYLLVSLEEKSINGGSRDRKHAALRPSMMKN